MKKSTVTARSDDSTKLATNGMHMDARAFTRWTKWARAMFLGCASVAGVASAREWTQVIYPSPLAILKAVAHTPLGWFACGEKSQIVHSTDGKVWRQVLGASLMEYDQVGVPRRRLDDSTIPPGKTLRSLAWKDGLLVVVGDSGTVLTTRDGIRWTFTKTVDTLSLQDVASDGTRFVVVGSAGAILRSSDGVVWERRASPVVAGLTDIVHFGGRFYARGDDGSMIDSKDGWDWSVRNTDSVKFVAIAANKNGVLATVVHRHGDDFGVMAWRAVGDTGWTNLGTIDIPLMTQFGGVVADDSSWLVTNEVGQAWRTRDGRTWDPDSLVGPDWNGLWRKHAVWFDGTWISLSTKYLHSTDMVRYALAASRDFNHWQQVHVGTRDHIVAVDATDDGWWLVQSEGNHGRSPTTLHHTRDLVHWDDSWIGTGFPTHIDTCSGKRILWGSYLRGVLDYSTRDAFEAPTLGPTYTYQDVGCGDGEVLSLAWRPFTSDVTSRLWKASGDSVVDTIPLGWLLRGVRRFKGRWVLAWVDQGDTSWSATSLDGRTWSDSLRLFANSVEDLATDGSVLVGVGDSGTVMTTFDGSRWERTTVGDATDWWRITYTGGWFFATGARGHIALSRNGLDWTLDSLPKTNRMVMSAAVHADTLLVGTEGGDVYFSPGLTFVSVAPRRNPSHRFRRDGTKFRIGVDPGRTGPWYLMDIAGRRRAVGRLDEAAGLVEFDLRECGRGILVPSWTAGSIVVHP